MARNSKCTKGNECNTKHKFPSYSPSQRRDLGGELNAAKREEKKEGSKLFLEVKHFI